MRHPWHIVILAAVVAFPAGAEDDRRAWTGEIDFGYRTVDVEGNEDKYREDVNLADGALRLFSLDLGWRPEAGGALDEIRITAGGLGGDPRQYATFRARRAGRFDLKADWRSTNFFYRDAGYFFSDIGDLHTWDTRRDRMSAELRVTAARWLDLRFGADVQERDGASRTSRSLQRDVFLLSRPVDQSSSSYWIAADVRLGWADLTIERRERSWENRWQMSAFQAEGVEGSAAFLDSFDQLQVQDADAPMTRVSVAGTPGRRVRFRAGWARTEAELRYDVDGAWDGLDSGANAFSTTLVNGGAVDRDIQMWDAEVGVGILRDLELALSFARREYDQDGTIDYLERQVGGDADGTISIRGDLTNRLELDRADATLLWRAARWISLHVGGGVQTRTADFELAGPEVETERTLIRGGVRIRPSGRWDVRLDYETGSDDDPYTRVSPTDVERIVARVRVTPLEGLGIGAHWRDETRENLSSYPLGLPTDDVPPVTELATAEFTTTVWGLTASWSGRGPLDLVASYTRSELGANADIVYVTGFTFVPSFDLFTAFDRTGYVADGDVWGLDARVRLTRAWSLGAHATLVRNEGTFPLERDVLGADVRYTHRSGVSVGARFDRYSLDETNPYAGDPAAPTPDVNDYDADLMTLSLGYRF